MRPVLLPAILGAGALAGMAVGAAAGFLVQWEVTDWLIRHSPYRNHANGHVWTRA
jgi:protein subunit release factor B